MEKPFPFSSLCEALDDWLPLDGSPSTFSRVHGCFCIATGGAITLFFLHRFRNSSFGSKMRAF